MENVIKHSKYGGFGNSILDDILMIFLSVVSVALLFFEVLTVHTTAQESILEIADSIISFMFLTEFTIRFYLSTDRNKFVKKHWWELLAAIPLTFATNVVIKDFNVIAVFRVLRLLRIVRLVVRIKILLDASNRIREHAHTMFTALMGGVVILMGAFGFHYMEFGKNPNVHSLWDSLWWTVVTLTTVGYGDIYPVTVGGRILAMFLMLGGIATFSVITASIAAKLLEKKS